MNPTESSPLYHQAIVIGGSIAGLSVARVLADHFQHVTVIERDAPPQPTLFRKGTPQARHPHILLKGGELALEQLFPGLRQEVVGQGAHVINAGLDQAWQIFGRWRLRYPFDARRRPKVRRPCRSPRACSSSISTRWCTQP